jgi:predicted transcriptional regulator
MSTKQMVLDAVKKLPEDATIEDINEQIEILAAIQRGIEAADEGRVVSHEEVKRRLATWTSK